MYNDNKYILMYKRNICFYYTKRCIIQMFIVIIYSLIHKSVFLLYKTMYNNNIYFSLHEMMYNNNMCFLYRKMYNEEINISSLYTLLLLYNEKYLFLII